MLQRNCCVDMPYYNTIITLTSLWTGFVVYGWKRNIKSFMNRPASILTDCSTAKWHPSEKNKSGNEETLQIMNILKLSGIMSLLMGGYVITCCQPWSSDTGSIHRYHHFIQPVYSYSGDQRDEKSREHVWSIICRSAIVSQKQIFLCILWQITLISECNEIDRQRNKAQTITKSGLTSR